MRPASRLFLAAAALMAASCSDSTTNGDAQSVRTVVMGRVMDDRGEACPGASVELEANSTSVVTGRTGHFALEVPAGSHRLRVTMNDVPMCEACFSVAESDQLDLGDLYPGRDSGCERPTGCGGDLDCDGLLDSDELEGWEVTIVLGDGDTELVRHVTSDPSLLDTDGDGLTDADEFAARTDPSRRDTDGDVLPDYAEIHSYKSNPRMVDSDADSCGPDRDQVSDPNLWDGWELLLTKTSPSLADTDGDGMSDWEEIHSGGTDPRVADLPRMSLDLHGDPNIVLNVTDVTTNQQTEIASTLEKETASYEQTDTESTKMSIENTVKIHTELEGGTSSWIPSFNAKVTTDTEFKHGYARESLSSWKESSVRASQQNYEQQTSSITNISYDDGMLWTGVKIVNSSDLAFQVGDLRITAYRLKPGGAFTPIGNLTLGRLGSEGWEPFEGAAGEFTLGPSVEYVDVVGASELPAQVMRALVSNPTAMMFEIGSYTLYKLDEFGAPTVNFATIGESVVQRTGLIVIDYGDGAVERHMVATNVFRYPDGSGRGLTVADALDVVGVSHETMPRDPDDAASRRVLTRIGHIESYVDAADPMVRGFWVVGGTGPIFDAFPDDLDFDDIVIRQGERVTLCYVEDTDGDRIFDREEYLLGTEPTAPDSDRDGLTDYEESKVGWTVTVEGGTPYDVHSDPRFPDVDEDFLYDGAEQSLGTDPYDRDTDGDGYEDGFDPSPLTPPCLSGTPLLLSAWWDGTANGLIATDLWIADGIASDGVLSAAGVAASLGGEPVFLFNTDPPEHVGVPTAGLSPVHEFSVALRVRWAGAPPTAPPGSYGTILTKGPRHRATYALSIDDAGKLRFSAYRRVFDKRWGWFFGWIDNLAADQRYNQRTEVEVTEPLPLNEWQHVVVTFGRDYMRIYVEGVEAASVDLDWWSTSGSVRRHVTTAYLHRNDDELWLGADQGESGHPAEGRYNGYLDEVQYYHRSLTAFEVAQLYSLGLCR